MYIRVEQSGNKTYPYSIAKLKAEFPHVSFPSQPREATLNEYGVYVVQPTDKPEFNAVTQRLVEAEPQLVRTRFADGRFKEDDPNTPEDEAWEWVQVWEVIDLTQEELDQSIVAYNAKQEQLRAQAYRDESDPIFFKWQRGETTEQAWLDAVADVKSRYLDYNT